MLMLLLVGCFVRVRFGFRLCFIAGLDLVLGLGCFWWWCLVLISCGFVAVCSFWIYFGGFGGFALVTCLVCVIIVSEGW